MNENIMRKVGFGDEMDLIKKGQCPLCHEKVDVKNFRDELSVREFKISGLCQKCQDDIFEIGE